MSALTPSQQDALKAKGNVLVMAGAGTGKTKTLVERCCALLEGGCALDELLMVTFTEAAAAEMRHRIHLRLASRRDELAATDPKTAQHLDEQLALLDTADISTIHGFCLKLIREHFHHERLQLDPEFSVFSDAQIHQIKHETLDALLESHYEGDTEEAIAFRDFVTVRARGDEDRVRELIWRLHRYSQSLAAPEGWVEAQLASFNGAEPTLWRSWFAESFAECRVRWVARFTPFAFSKNVELCLAALGTLPAKPAVEQITEALVAIAEAFKAKWPHGHAGKVRDVLDDCFSEAEFLHSLTPTADGVDPLAQDWEWTRHQMLTLLGLTRDFSAAFAQAKREAAGVDFSDLEQFALRLLWDANTESPTAIALGWRARLTHVFVDEYQDINAAQDTILRAISRDGADANRFLVGDVKQSIYRFRLADPTIFQAYKRAWSMAEEGRARHSVPAELGQTDGGAHGVTRPTSPSQTIALSDNFRSRAALLDFINPFFASLMREEIGGVSYDEAAELKFGVPEKRESLSRKLGDEPAVEFHLRLKDGNEDDGAGDDNLGGGETAANELVILEATEKEARMVALRLRELRDQKFQVWGGDAFRDVEWSDMVVLLRSPSNKVESFAKEFSRAGVPLHAARGGFYDTTEVSDLLSLLQLLDNPLQDIPLLAVLRSPLVGLSLDELAIIHAAFPKEKIWTATKMFCFKQTNFTDAAAAIAQATLPKLKSFHASFEAWRNLSRLGAISDCLETVLTDSHYEAMLLAMPRGQERRANVNRLLNLTRQFDPHQRQGLMRFLDFVKTQRDADAEEESAPPASTNAVRLMSIHKSKGLEFPVVALPDLAKMFNFQDLSGDVLLDAALGVCPQVVPPKSNGHYASLPHWIAKRRQRRDSLGEEMRLLYVALTRARDRLILSATTTTKVIETWHAGGDGEPITPDKLLGAKTYFAWLQLWLPRVTAFENWKGDRAGATPLMRWTIYSENDARLLCATSAGDDIKTNPPATLSAETSARLAWNYPLTSATSFAAKTSVTALRRLVADELSDEMEKRFQPKAARSERARPRAQQREYGVSGQIHQTSLLGGAAAPGDGRTPGKSVETKIKLSAAEIGTAHHAFLQHVALDSVGDVESLAREVERLVVERVLSRAEADVLDMNSLAQFWSSSVGQEIRSQAGNVRRELPFTMRMEVGEMNRMLKVESAEVRGGAGDFVVVQGVADLVVLLNDEVWLLDFKTDDVRADELGDKLKQYEPQLRIYAEALERIHKKPVTKCWLHFLRVGKTVEL